MSSQNIFTSNFHNEEQTLFEKLLSSTFYHFIKKMKKKWKKCITKFLVCVPQSDFSCRNTWTNKSLSYLKVHLRPESKIPCEFLEGNNLNLRCYFSSSTSYSYRIFFESYKLDHKSTSHLNTTFLELQFRIIVLYLPFIKAIKVMVK